MRNCVYFKIIVVLLLFVTKTNCNANGNFTIVKDTIIPKKHLNKNSSLLKTTGVAPEIYTTGDQIYCPGTSLNIVQSVTIIVDPTDPPNAVYIQISSGYSINDNLTLAGTHPNITSSWIASEGKLKLTGSGLSNSNDIENAVKDVLFSNSSASASGIRTFSISLGSGTLSYLPRNNHFYEYVSAPGINWTAAKVAAETRSPYYGLQGYLATLTAADEAQLAGAQAEGTGWIGGSDLATEGTWKWVTGPEGLANGGTGTTFWIGKNNGIVTTPFNYANWNNPNEPNDSNNNEDYAHITAKEVGNLGTWNDLAEQGDPISNYNYYPKGYIVEYGDMTPGDVNSIHTSDFTKMKISEITSTASSPICGSGTINLSATTNEGSLNWYDASGNLLTLLPTNNFTTQIITNTSSTSSLITTYYIDNGHCRIPITTTVLAVPTITSATSTVYRCGTGTEVLQVSTSIGTANWFSSSMGGSSIASGTSFTTPTLSQGTTTTYFAEANDNSCVSTNRTPVTITTYKLPDVTDETVILCKSKTVTLDAKIAGMNYLWSNSGGTNQTFTVSNSGVYNVQVTSPSPENCSKTKIITVEEHDIPEIDRIDVNETTVEIYLKKAETYFEYSVDGINYQSSNTFVNVSGGLQTAYVREVNSCSFDTDNFVVLIAPKFFTPNNDNHNDYWEIDGLAYYPDAELIIFDRYGKFILQLNASKLTWDGMLNKIPVPADDYWYVLKIDQTKLEKRGHFSLKR